MSETFDDGEEPCSSPAVVYAPHLIVLLECDRPMAGSSRHCLEGVDQVTVGRGEERSWERASLCGLRTLDLRVPGRSLSAAHARLVPVGSAWAIEDSGSKNGTFVNGGRVERAVLSGEDIVELGHTLFRVNYAVGIPADAPRDVDVKADSAPVTLDPQLHAQLERVAMLASSLVPLLIVGESGTGKEVLARWMHDKTGRTGEFVAVNCGAIPAALFESQMFGHVKGAFSGATRDEVGFVRSADGGTLFLDEVGDLPLSSQAALLRVLQEREVVPVGAHRPVPVDARVIAATHVRLEAMVKQGTFRRDLFARIAGTTIELPPLRDRRDDIGILVASLLSKAIGGRGAEVTLSPAVGRALVAYGWPLNVRELGHALEASLVLAAGSRIEREHLPEQILGGLPPASRSSFIPGEALSEREQTLRLQLLGLLSEHSGNLTEVGKSMGKARMQVYRWCRRFGIDPSLYRMGG
jgi:transcriptional regulator with PAS, ATPase and Fis domain